MITFIIMNFFTYFIFILLITSILLLIPFLGISIKEEKKVRGIQEILSPFECGFNPIRKKYLGFCVQFLNIAILFLLVDLEIALLIPFFFNTYRLEKVFFRNRIISGIIILFLLILLVLEKLIGGLAWKEEISEYQLYFLSY